MTQSNYLSPSEAARILGVSTATLRNWEKTNLVKANQEKPKKYEANHILDLQLKLKQGEISRLQKRANKSQAHSKLKPVNDLVEVSNSDLSMQILDKLRDDFQNLDTSMIKLVINLYLVNGFIQIEEIDNKIDIQTKSIILKKELTNWLLSGNYDLNNLIDYKLQELLPCEYLSDFVAHIYQSITPEKDKSKTGSYYTPIKIVNDSIIKLPKDTQTFLDPACGSGQFLLSAIRNLRLHPKNLYGFDIDDTAVRIARLNILNEYKFADIPLNVYKLDSIRDLSNGTLISKFEELTGFFDAIATNPPWGSTAELSRNPIPGYNYSTNELFTYFIEKSYNLLRTNGKLSLILPESILNVATHEPIRKFLAKNSVIRSIDILGRPFSGVMSSAIRLEIEKSIPLKSTKVIINHGNESNNTLQYRFASNANTIFDIRLNNQDQIIIDKVYANAISRLESTSVFALGIVTGHNKKFTRQVREAGTIPVIRGKDLDPYIVKEPATFLFYDKNQMQQTPSWEIFNESEKLLYKFISSRLVFSYDDKKYATLNSANILIPRVSGLSIKAILAFLNSNLLQYVFNKKFNTYKVLKSHLQLLPFPKISDELAREIESEVDELINGKHDKSTINSLVYKAYKLDDVKEIELVEVWSNQWKN